MCRQIKSNELKNYKLKLALFVLLVGLRRHPQGQHVHNAALSEKQIYCLLARNRKAGQTPTTTGVGVRCSPGKGCIGLESTTAQYAAYNETTVCTYLYILYIIPVWVPSTILPPLHEKDVYALAGHSSPPWRASLCHERTKQKLWLNNSTFYFIK